MMVSNISEQIAKQPCNNVISCAANTGNAATAVAPAVVAAAATAEAAFATFVDNAALFGAGSATKTAR